MAILTTLDAESNNLVIEFPVDSGGSIAIVGSPVHQGSFAFQLPWGPTSNFGVKGFTASATVYLLFALWVDVGTIPSANIYPEILYLQNGTGTVAYLSLNVQPTTGVVGIRALSGDGTQIGSITTIPSPGQYHDIGFRVVAHPTAGQIELQLDGSQIALGTGLTMTNSGAMTLISVQANEGTLSGGAGFCYSDTYILRDDFFPSFLTLEQEGYQWRRDDGSETTATPIGAQDTPL